MSEYPIAGGDNYANAEAQDEFEREQNRKYEQWKSQQETIESQAKPESTGEAVPTDSTEKKDDKGLIYNVGHTAAAVPLGTADFVSDAIGIVPWLKPVDDWWDENSPRSNHPVHKIIRDAS